MTNKRVLFIVPSLRRAGAENQIVQLVNGLSTDKFEKHLLTYLPDDALRTSVATESVTYHKLDRKGRLDFAMAGAIGKIIDENEIDIIHCTLLNALLYGVLGTRSARRKPALVCAIHTTKPASLKHALAVTLLYKHFLKRCEQVWFMCHSQAARWIEEMPFLEEHHHVVHNGINVEDFDPDLFVQAGRDFRDELGIPGSAKVICSVAGLRPEKLHRVLVQSFKSLTQRLRDDCYLLLAGVGQLENELKERTQASGLCDRVFFLGEISDVRALLAASDCKVLASAAETFSMAMLEAMAMRVPVVSTRVGGAGEAIEDGESGVLITPGNVEELSNKLLVLLSDERKLVDMGRQARKTIIGEFAYSKMIERSTRKLLEVRVAA